MSIHIDFITCLKVWSLDPLKIGLPILIFSWGPLDQDG